MGGLGILLDLTQFRNACSSMGKNTRQKILMTQLFPQILLREVILKCIYKDRDTNRNFHNDFLSRIFNQFWLTNWWNNLETFDGCDSLNLGMVGPIEMLCHCIYSSVTKNLLTQMKLKIVGGLILLSVNQRPQKIFHQALSSQSMFMIGLVLGVWEVSSQSCDRPGSQ